MTSWPRSKRCEHAPQLCRRLGRAAGRRHRRLADLRFPDALALLHTPAQGYSGAREPAIGRVEIRRSEGAAGSIRCRGRRQGRPIVLPTVCGGGVCSSGCYHSFTSVRSAKREPGCHLCCHHSDDHGAIRIGLTLPRLLLSVANGGALTGSTRDGPVHRPESSPVSQRSPSCISQSSRTRRRRRTSRSPHEAGRMRTVAAARVRAEALLRLGRGDIALNRLDISAELDGVEDGIWIVNQLEAQGVRVFNRPPALLAAHDKLITARLIKAAGVPHPRTRRLDAATAADGLRFPVVAKPRFGSWGRDVELCADVSALEQYVARMSTRKWWSRRRRRAGARPASLDGSARSSSRADEVVGAAVRIAAPNEWRTNVALGGMSMSTTPPAEACELALVRDPRDRDRPRRRRSPTATATAGSSSRSTAQSTCGRTTRSVGTVFAAGAHGRCSAAPQTQMPSAGCGLSSLSSETASSSQRQPQSPAGVRVLARPRGSTVRTSDRDEVRDASRSAGGPR